MIIGVIAIVAKEVNKYLAVLQILQNAMREVDLALIVFVNRIVRIQPFLVVQINLYVRFAKLQHKKKDYLKILMTKNS